MKLFARYYDSFMKPIEKKYIMNWRKDLLFHATGEVLEIGSGTGINFPLYNHCKNVIAIEPNPYMKEKAEVRKRKARVPITITQCKAEDLPFPNDHFDTIVVTLVLCSVDDPLQVLEELKRVLKPTGTVLFLEHVKMEQPVFSGLQKLLTPAWKRICDGCHLNRKTEETIINSGLKIQTKKTHLSGFAISVTAQK